jgi:serine/threonine-protein kinase
MENPFVYKEPLRGKEGFCNRASEITRIASRMAAERPQSVSVVGELRSGKTSLFRYLCDPQVQAEYLEDPGQCVLLFLDLKSRPPDGPPAFFERLDRALREAGQEGMKSGYDGFGDRVKKLMQEGRKLVLLLDDFGLVTRHSGFPIDFFSFMRSIANSNDVGYVTTSETALQNLCHTEDIQESPFFNIFTTVNLVPFKEEEARNLVAGVEPEAREWVLKLGGASPYLLQMAASLAFEAGQNGPVEEKRVAERAFKEALPYFEKLWEGGFSEAQQLVLRALATGKEAERRHQYAAESLERRGHVHRVEDGYAFRSALLERFVRERGGGSLWRKLFG